MLTLKLDQLCDPGEVQEVISSHPDADRAADAAERVRELALATSELVDAASECANKGTPAVVVYAPGRIEFLGKHTDYAGGSSLTCAVNHSFFIVGARTQESGIRIRDMTLDRSVFLDYENPFRTVDSSWLRYPASVTERFVQNFGIPDHGVCLSFSNTIPRASGMSSSSAFVVGLYLVLAALAEVQSRPPYAANLQKPEELADYLGSVENGYSYKSLIGKRGVGTRGGAQDHTAILYSKKGQLGHYGYRPLHRLDTVALPEGTSFVIGSSGVRSRKAGSELGLYNSSVELSEVGLAAWNQAEGSRFSTLGKLVSSPAFTLDKLARILKVAPGADSQLSNDRHATYDRVEQFVTETTEIIPTAIHALRAGDLNELGDVVDRSQDLTDRLLGNQVDETRLLAQIARKNGAIAASAFGAGFGGSVWALVPTEESDAFLRTWMAAYGQYFPRRIRYARFFTDPTGPGAFVLGASAHDLLLEPKL